MVPELLVLALEVQRSPIGFAHLGDPTRPLPDAFGDWLAASGAALAPARIQATADGLGTDPETLSAAFRLLLRQTLLLPQADHYRVLGLSRTCSAQALKRHHGLLLRLLHPDRTPGAQARDVQLAARINAAYQVLRDSEARRVYDEGLVPLAAEDPIDLFCRWGPPTGGAPVAGGPPWRSRTRGPALALILGLGLLAAVLLLLLQPPRGSALRLNPGLAGRPGPGPAYLNDPDAVAADRPPEWPIPPPAAPPVAPKAPPAAAAVVPKAPPPAPPVAPKAPAQVAAQEQPPASTQTLAPTPVQALGSKAPAQVAEKGQPPAPTQTLAQATTPVPPVAPKTPVQASPPAAPVAPKAPVQAPAQASPPAPPVAPKAPAQAPPSAAAVAPRAPAQAQPPAPPVAPKAPAQAPPVASKAPPQAPPVASKAPPQAPPVASKAPAQVPPPSVSPAPSAAKAANPLGPGTRGGPGAAPDPRRGSGGQLESQDRLIARLERAFSSGDLPGLVSLFTANAEVNGSRGAEAVRRAYQSAAAGAQRPRLNIVGLSWRRLGDQRLLGRGTMRRGHNAERGTNPGGHTGPLEIELVPWMGDYKISRLTHPFAPP